MTPWFRGVAARLIHGEGCLMPTLVADQSGSPAIEFALVAPVMFTLLAGSYDVTQIFIAMRQVTSTAQKIVQIATEQAVQPDQSNALTVQQAHQAMTAIYAMMPKLRSGADASPYSVTLSAIVFAANTPGCAAGSACPNVAWSTALSLSATKVRRRCRPVTQVKPTEQATMDNIATLGMTTVKSVVVADVSYTYQPLFSGFVTGPVTLRRTAFLPPRAGDPAKYVRYDRSNASANADICSGYG